VTVSDRRVISLILVNLASESLVALNEFEAFLAQLLLGRLLGARILALTRGITCFRPFSHEVVAFDLDHDVLFA
jgi:hypothetical protein